MAPTGPSPALDAMATPERIVNGQLDATPADDADAQRVQAERVRELVRLGRIGEARTEAGRYYQRWPNGPDVVSLEQLTGLHPVPSGER